MSDSEKSPPLALASEWADFAKRAAAGAQEWEPGSTGLPEYELGRATGYGECAVLLSAKIAPAWDAAAAQLAIATGALRDIKACYDPGDFGHDIAHSRLDEIGGVKPSPPGEAEQLREQLGVIRDRLNNLARGLDLSAQASYPSKKSEIERGCARVVVEIAASMDLGEASDA